MIYEYDKLKSLFLGMQNDNILPVIQIDMNKVIRRYPGCYFEIVVRRPNDTDSYPVYSTLDENGILTWHILRGDVYNPGQGFMQIVTKRDGDEVMHSGRITTTIGESITGSTQEPPKPLETWFLRVLDAAKTILDAIGILDKINRLVEEWGTLKGEKGDPFVYSDFTQEQLAALKGPKGDAFTYADFTPEQLEKLKGEKGDAFTYADFTPEQLEKLKGEKGDAFTYADFTPEQLEKLKGPKGDAFTFADFTPEQLAKLKGEKGDAFTYADFTTEQLEKLKGPKGDAFTFADFTPEQLEGLKAKAPILGIDYFTDEDKSAMVNQVKDGVQTTVSELSNKLTEQSNRNNLQDNRLTKLENEPKTDPSIALRVEKLEAAAEGHLYMFKQDTDEAYEKVVPDGAMKWATLDSVSGKTIVMNQLVGDTYPVPFEGEVYEQVIDEDKAESVTVEKLGGKTIVWNQLINPVNYRGSKVEKGLTVTDNKDGTITLNGTTEGLVSSRIQAYFDKGATSIFQGHKYLIPFIDVSVGLYARIETVNGGFNVTTPTFTSTLDGTFSCDVRMDTGHTYTNVTIPGMVFDLTTMFGETIANSMTAEQFRQLFPKDYYPYSEPTLMSFDTKEVVSRGANLLDLKSWYDSIATEYNKNGLSFTYSESEQCFVINGTSTNTSMFMSKVLDTPLPYRSGMVTGVKYLGGTVSKNDAPYAIFYIGGSATQQGSSNWSTVDLSENDGTKQIPTNGTFGTFKYITRVWLYISGGVTFSNYKMQPIIAYNSTYAPYRDPITIPIPESVRTQYPLRSAGTVYDTIQFDGAKWWHHKRVGSVDLETFAWTSGWQGAAWYTDAIIDGKPATGTSVMATLLSDNYAVGTDVHAPANVGLMNYWLSGAAPNQAKRFAVNNGSDTTRPTGHLHYELAEEVKTDITSLMNWDGNISVEPGGTLTFANIHGDDYCMPIPVAESINVTEWEQPLDATHKYAKNGAVITGQTSTAVVGGQDNVIDLTRAFGSRNEPSDVAGMFPMTEQIDGELVSLSADKVVSRGKNLLNIEPIQATWATVSSELLKQINSLKPGTYCIGSRVKLVGVTKTPTKDNLFGLICVSSVKSIHSQGSITIANTKVGYTNSHGIVTTITNENAGTFTAAYIYGCGNNTDGATGVAIIDNIYAIKSDTVVDYAQYQESTTDLSSLVAKYFPDGMKSAGTVHDEIDLERGVAVKRVETRTFDGTEIWNEASNAKGTYYVCYTNLQAKGVATPLNMTASRYTASVFGYSTGVEDSISLMSNGLNVAIKPEATYESLQKFKDDLLVTINYELAEPIETPIDPVDLADLTALTVESDGTLTFQSDHPDYHVPVPNQQTWMIKTTGGA